MLLGLLWESQLQVLCYWWSSLSVLSLVAATLSVDHQGAHLQLLQQPHNPFLPLSLSTQQTPMANKVASSPIQLLGLMSTRHHHKSSRCLPTLLHSRLHTFPQPTLHTLPPTHLGKLRDTSMTRDCTFISVCISVYHLLIGIGHATEHCY